MILTTEVGELGPVGKESSYQKSRYIKTEKISLTKNSKWKENKYLDIKQWHIFKTSVIPQVIVFFCSFEFAAYVES